MGDEVPDYDVAINIHKGVHGYGIYFAQRGETIFVTKIDEDSEAKRAGVQPGDELCSVQDLDKKLPRQSPGVEFKVNHANYRDALDNVRAMNHVRLTFRSPGFAGFASNE
jgi:predicted metalloprotease with PDZ domain